jgi:pimeloyl-ACP methyl ester carboxylesterase
MTAAPAELLPLPPVRLPAEPWTDSLLTRLGTALDSAVLRAMTLVVDAVLMPKPEEIPAMRAAAQPFLHGELARAPERFFDFLSGPLSPLGVVDRRRRETRGGSIVGREIATAYRPFGETDGAPGGGSRVPIEHWTHQRARRGTVLALHGFSMGQPRIDGIALMASQWFQRGLDVVLMTLPSHGARTPTGARFSGERFAAPNPADLGEAVRQAIYEIRLVSSWLRAETGAPVGLLGLSLGGYLAALMAGLTGDLDFVIPMVPPVCMGDLAFGFFARSRRAASGSALAFSYEELRAIYRVHSPLAHALRLPKERILIIAGRGDRIVPPEHPHALWRHWNEPDIFWFSGSHLAPFRRRRIVDAVVRHLRRLDVL